jgi:cyclopropane-fatty-acyl-phospholipid synthase
MRKLNAPGGIYGGVAKAGIASAESPANSNVLRTIIIIAYARLTLLDQELIQPAANDVNRAGGSMSLERISAQLAERVPFPDVLLRAGMRSIIAANEAYAEDCVGDHIFAHRMAARPIAEFTKSANVQHYEIPAAFFAEFLGPQRKYSSCFYPTGHETLAQAEEIALEATARHADLRDGQDILELGCGSLTLWIAKKYPRSSIVAVSNSASQRLYIEEQARLRGFNNISVMTADMNEFAPQGSFDRIVSVEMFEHMANWGPLLSRCRSWLRDDGRMFLHVFAHQNRAARYNVDNQSDWIAQHFFTGGIMPSHGLIRQFQDIFAVEEEWRWSGHHYRLTALQWLAQFDANGGALDRILLEVYGRDAALWRRRWRMFLLATAELFGFRDGNVWGVSHYRLQPAR